MRTIVSGSKTVMTLWETNKVLSKRVRKSELFYVVAVILVSLFLATAWSILIFTNIIEFANEDEKKAAFSAAILFVFVFDVLFTLLRFQSGTLIEPHHLQIFAIGKTQKLQYNFLLTLTDHKSLLYLSTALVLFIFYWKEFSIFRALLSVAVISIFLLTMITWSLVAYGVCRDFLVAMKSNVLILFSLLVIFLQVLVLRNKLGVFASIPLVGYVGNALYGLRTSHLSLTVLNVFLLSLSLVLGSFLLRLLPSRG